MTPTPPEPDYSHLKDEISDVNPQVIKEARELAKFHSLVQQQITKRSGEGIYADLPSSHPTVLYAQPTVYNLTSIIDDLAYLPVWLPHIPMTTNMITDCVDTDKVSTHLSHLLRELVDILCPTPKYDIYPDRKTLDTKTNNFYERTELAGPDGHVVLMQRVATAQIVWDVGDTRPEVVPLLVLCMSTLGEAMARQINECDERFEALHANNTSNLVFFHARTPIDTHFVRDGFLVKSLAYAYTVCDALEKRDLNGPTTSPTTTPPSTSE